MIRLTTTVARARKEKTGRQTDSVGWWEETRSSSVHREISLDSSSLQDPTCASSLRPAGGFLCWITCARAVFNSCVLFGLLLNVGLTRTAMTGKLADKIPLTMSSLINTIPDSLYPEEDIPTSMNIFTSTESINHYSQMNTGEFLYLLYLFSSPFGGSKCDESATVVSGFGGTCLRSGSVTHKDALLEPLLYEWVR